MTNQEDLRAGEHLLEEPQALRTSFGPLNFAGVAEIYTAGRMRKMFSLPKSIYFWAHKKYVEQTNEY